MFRRARPVNEIDAATLLATELVLATVAPKLVPVLRGIRDCGPVEAGHSTTDSSGFEMYHLELSWEEKRNIKEALLSAQVRFGAEVEVIASLVATWSTIVQKTA